MKRKYRKWGSLLIVALMLGVLFATVGVSQAAKEVKLLVWTGFPELNPYYEIAAEDFEKEHPNVKIDVAAFPLRDFERKIAMSLVAGTGADLFLLGRLFFPRYLESGYLLENPSKVDDFLKKAGRYDIPWPWEGVDVKGKSYGLPLFMGGAELFWNKTMFAEVGLSNPPKTYDELMEYARKLAKYDAKGNLIRGGISLRLSGGGAGVAEKWRYWLWSAGGTMLEETPTGKYHSGYNNEAGRDALKWYIDALYKYHVDDFKIKHDAEAFALEKTAMFQREGWVIGHLKEHAPHVNYGTAHLPRWRRWGKRRNQNFMVVPSFCKKDAAWDYLLYLQRPKYQRYMLKNIGWIPCRQDIDYEDIFKEMPQFRSFIESPKGYVTFVDKLISPQDEVQTRLAERLMAAYIRKDLLDDPEGIAKVIAAAAEETDNILKEAELYGER